VTLSGDVAGGWLWYLRFVLPNRQPLNDDNLVTKPPIRVMIVDDHPVMRKGIAAVLEREVDFTVVSEASDGREGVEHFRSLLPDVTLMDLQMPCMKGIDAISAILSEFPKARIVVLTTYSGDVQALRAIRAGAYGYVLKSAMRKELLDTIRSVHAGRRHIPESIAIDIAEHVSADALSKREVEILGEVAAGNANKEVGARLCISGETVKAHMKNILAKLGAKDRTHAVTIATRRGILEG